MYLLCHFLNDRCTNDNNSIKKYRFTRIRRNMDEKNKKLSEIKEMHTTHIL